MAQSDRFGHIFEGFGALFLGIWWIFGALRRYSLAKSFNNSKYRYRNTPTYQCPCFPTKPIEGWIKAVVGFTGSINELNWGDPDHGVFTGKATEHALMWVFFGFSGLIDLLTHYFPHITPRNLDHISLALCFFMKYWFLGNHKHGKNMLDIAVHGFLQTLDLAGLAATLSEIFWSESVVPALIRGVSATVLGTWFVNIGFILYPSSGIITWDDSDHDQLMLVASLFGLHLILVLLCTLILMFTVHYRMQSLVRKLDLKAVCNEYLEPYMIFMQNEADETIGKETKCI